LSLTSDFSNLDVGSAANKESAMQMMDALRDFYTSQSKTAILPSVDLSYICKQNTDTGFSWEIAITSSIGPLTSGEQTALLAYRQKNGQIETIPVVWTQQELQQNNVMASTLRTLVPEGNNIVKGNLIFGENSSMGGGTEVTLSDPNNPDAPPQLLTTQQPYRPSDLLEALGILPSSVKAAGLETSLISATPSPDILAATLLPTTGVEGTLVPTLAPTLGETSTPKSIDSSAAFLSAVQVQFPDIASGHASPAELQAYDTWVAQVKASMDAANTGDNLKSYEYDLLQTILDNQPPIVLTGNETQEQLASHVLEIPQSLLNLVMADEDNMVAVHQKNHLDYGLGVNVSPHPDHTILVDDAHNWSGSGNFGFQVNGEKIPVATDTVFIDGDLVGVFDVGNPNAVGVITQMFDDDNTTIRYALSFIPLSTVTTTPADTCIMGRAGLMATVSCPAGISIPRVQIIDAITGKRVEGTLADVLELMGAKERMTLAGGGVGPTDWIWINGLSVMGGMQVLKLPGTGTQ
jgi:hypothetical protein